MIKSLKRIKKALIVTSNPTLSGLASLLSIMQYYESYVSIEELRVLSGTKDYGSTLLGLVNAAKKSGFNAKGFKLNIETLQEVQSPVIVYITSKIAEQIQYAVVFGVVQERDEKKFILGDPLKGVSYLTQKQMEGLWANNICLIIEPTAEVFDRKIKKRGAFSIYKHIKNSNRLFVSIVLLSIICSAIGIFPILYLIQKKINFNIKENKFSIITGWMVCIVLVLIAKEFLVYFKNRIAILFSMTIEKALSDDFHDDFYKLPKTFFDYHSEDLLINKRKDIRRTGKSINVIMKRWLDSIISGVMILLTILILAPKSLLIILPLISLIVIFSTKLAKKFVANQEELRTSEDMSSKVFSFYCEGLNKMKQYIKKANFESGSKQAYLRTLYIISKSNGKKAAINSLARALSIVCFSLAAFLTTTLYSKQIISIGLYFSTIYLYVLLFLNTTQIGEMFIDFNKFNFSFKRVELFDFSFLLPDKVFVVNKVDTINRLDIDNLEYFDNTTNKEVIKTISFSITKGSMLGIVGQTKSGKSHLANQLIKYYPVKYGSLLINRHIDVNNVSNCNWYEQVAIVPQQPFVFFGSIIENIALSDAIHNTNKAMAFIKEFQLDIFFHTLSKCEQTFIGDGGVPISNSQKQIISIARAIYAEPQLLILDDPTMLLDKNTIIFLFDFINKIKHKTSIILLTTDTTLTKEYCDNVIFI